MDTGDERHIERFVQDPDRLSNDQRRAVERLIEEDPGARIYAEFLEDFYGRLDDEPLSPPRNHVDKFVARLFQREEEASVVPLRPFRPPRNTRPTVLAADTDSTPADAPTDKGRFIVLTTLAAENENLLVRIVKDRDTGQGRLYVLADPPEQRAHVVVSVPDFGLDLVADEEGRATFALPMEVPSERWAEVHAVVRRPVAARAVAPDEEVVMHLPTGGTVLGEREGRVLRIVVESHDGSDVPSHLVVAPFDNPARLFRLNASSQLECDTLPEVPLMLRVYK